MAAAGIAKLIEECGELIQVCGKKLAYWDADDHWDGSNLRERMIEEMGDVMAAILFVADQRDMLVAVQARTSSKFDLFGTWHEMLNNNDHGIDALRGTS